MLGFPEILWEKRDYSIAVISKGGAAGNQGGGGDEHKFIWGRWLAVGGGEGKSIKEKRKSCIECDDWRGIDE